MPVFIFTMIHANPIWRHPAIARLDQILSLGLEDSQESLINGSNDRIAKMCIYIIYEKFHKQMSTIFKSLLISVGQLWKW